MRKGISVRWTPGGQIVAESLFATQYRSRSRLAQPRVAAARRTVAVSFRAVVTAGDYSPIERAVTPPPLGQAVR